MVSQAQRARAIRKLTQGGRGQAGQWWGTIPSPVCPYQSSSNGRTMLPVGGAALVLPPGHPGTNLAQSHRTRRQERPPGLHPDPEVAGVGQ